MMKAVSSILGLAMASLALVQAKAMVDYSGYQVLRVQVRTEQEAETLNTLQEENLFDFWTEILLGKHVDIMAAPTTIASLYTWLEDHDLLYSVMIQDVAPLLELERINVGNTTREEVGHSMDWTSYHPLDEMYGWFDYLETTYDFIETESIGKSYEGQEMIVLKV